MAEHDRRLAAFVGMILGKRVEEVTPLNSLHKRYHVVNRYTGDDGPIDHKIFGELMRMHCATERADGLSIYRNDLVTAVAENPADLPQSFALYQNYPNPFNPGTKIKFELRKASRVTLEVQNLLGQTVATLVDEIKPAGAHTVVFNAENLTNGVYLYRLRANGFEQVRKFLLMK